jgi:hypothetical protein
VSAWEQATARHNCDGSQPHGWTGCYQASEVGQAGAGTTADGSAPRQPVRVPVTLRVMPWCQCRACQRSSQTASPDTHSCVAPTKGVLKPRPRSEDQIAKASSTNATGNRRFTGVSTASS